MRKMLFWGMVLSLFWWGCSDDSSVTGDSLPDESLSPPEPSSSSGITESIGSSAREKLSSASTDEAESSASEEPLQTTSMDYKFECSNNKEQKNSDLVVNTLSLSGSAPQAWKYAKGNSIYIEVGDIMMQCAISVKGMDVALSGDTLFADYEVDLSVPQANCICPTKVSFTVGEEFESAKYVNISGSTYQLRGTTYDGTMDSELKKVGFARGECMKDGLSLYKSADVLEAMLYCEEDNCVVEVNNVMDYCDVQADITQKRKADTLYVEYANMGAVSKCICNFDYHRFVIDQENEDIQYFSFKEKVFQIVKRTIE
jgi:hypothetical protein